MNKAKLIQKIACWAGYCLFAGYSSYMTAKSVAMSFELSQTWVVFVFVFIVALLAGWCLSLLIGEMQNRINPSRSKFFLSLLGFLLFWGVSFATNVHYMLMSNEGLKVVSAELGMYKNYVRSSIDNNIDKLQDQETAAIAICEARVSNLMDEFSRECESSIRYGFGDRAIGYLKDIENYLTSSAGEVNDSYNYTHTIFDPDKDQGDRGKTGAKEVMALKEKYSLRILEKLIKRETAIKSFYKMKIPQTKELKIIDEFINDSLYVVDIPQITDIATADVYYQFQKEQLTNNIYNRLSETDKAGIENLVKESTATDADNVDTEKYRYKVYPSSRMFSTFNVWNDMLHHRLPNDMRLLGWIFFSLIVDIVAFILRILAR